MINTKKIYEARLIVTENTKYETERISSFADAVKVCLCARAEKGLTFSIVRYDKELNAKMLRQSNIVKLSTDASRVAVYLIPTNEELLIARDTEALVKAAK